jgi:hypothetical protein
LGVLLDGAFLIFLNAKKDARPLTHAFAEGTQKVWE